MILVNGVPGNTLNVEDRGLSYGDGVFRTLRLRAGRPLLWERQHAKLQHDCARLDITCPASELLHQEIVSLGLQAPEGVAKLIITRGAATRGYVYPADIQSTRIVSVSAAPIYPDHYARQGVRVHLCALRLGLQPALAGIKHLNRLENVLAANEWQEADIAEGLLFDGAGHLISGTRSNVFLRFGDRLVTPKLDQCGVAGVQRDRVMTWADKHGVNCDEARVESEQVSLADEIFLVNSVFGLWPVREFVGYQCSQHEMAWKIQEWLNEEDS